MIPFMRPLDCNCSHSLHVCTQLYVAVIVMRGASVIITIIIIIKVFQQHNENYVEAAW